MTTPDPIPDEAPKAAGWLCDTEGHAWVWTWPIEGGDGAVGQCMLCSRITTAERDARVRREALREAADWLRDDMDEPWGMRAANRLDSRADRIEAGEQP
jgi:hypothetical protein